MIFEIVFATEPINLRIVFDEHSGSVICEYAECPHLSYTNIHESTSDHLPQPGPPHESI